MGYQSLSPALPREVAPDLRSLAETVLRLISRDSGPVALRMVGRALKDLEDRSRDERRAYLLNLRGVVYAQQQKETEALADLSAATQEAPHWHIPWYNLGLCHKRARRWQEAREALCRAAACARLRSAPPLPPEAAHGGGRSAKASAAAAPEGPSRAVMWNLGIVHSALQRWDEAREAWQACGLVVSPGGGPPELDLGLAQLSLPTKGIYAAERVWVQRIDPARARILSVVRYGAPCQFGDVVLCDSGDGHTGYCDGMIARDGDRPGTSTTKEHRETAMVYLDVLEQAGYALHVIRGEIATPAQATSLTERLREVELHIEVWSLTMRLPDDSAFAPEGNAVPLCAGLVVQNHWQDPQRAAESAMAELLAAARELGLCLYAPSLLEAAGDEVGAARHRKVLRQKSISLT